MSKELKKGIEILVLGQAILNLWIKTVKITFWSITHEPLAYLNFNALLSSLDNLLKDVYNIFQKVLIILWISLIMYKTTNEIVKVYAIFDTLISLYEQT